MRRQNELLRLRAIAITAGITVVIVTGCREEKDTVRVQTLEGTVEEVKVDTGGTGELAVRFFSAKQGQEIVGIGLVTRETEILINGVVSSLADIRPGDRVRGEVRIESDNEKRTQTVLKIHIDRPEPLGGS